MQRIEAEEITETKIKRLNEINYMLDATAELMNQLLPKLKELSEEISPTFNSLRAKLDRDETLLLLDKLTDNIETAVKLLDVIDRFRQEGTLDTLINLISRPAVSNMIYAFADLTDEEIEGIAKSAVVLTKVIIKLADPKVINLIDGMLSAAISCNIEEPPKIGIFGLISATRDEDVKTSTGIIVDFLKNFSRNIKVESSD